MLEEYLLVDIAIGAGGLISSELVASRTPALLLATCEHQVARCQYYETQGQVKYLGHRTFDEKDILASLEKAPRPTKLTVSPIGVTTSVCGLSSAINFNKFPLVS